MRPIPISLLFLPALALSAQTPPPAAKGPVLEAGEGLAVGLRDQQAVYGDASIEAPMGELAAFVWMQTEGPEWAARDLRFKCAGEFGGIHCSRPEGHGRVDIAKALSGGCDLALLAWARWSMQRWSEESGEGSAELRLLEAFRPFLGRRKPPAVLPASMGVEWVGRGSLLQASPKGLLQWMMDPVNTGFSEQAMRFLRPVVGLFARQGEDWWFKTAVGADQDRATLAQWVIGSDGQRYAALHFAKARPRAEALARFKALMEIRK